MIAKFKHEVSQARARGESDASIIKSLTSVLAPEQLLFLHRAAVAEKSDPLEAHVSKALLERASGERKPGDDIAIVPSLFKDGTRGASILGASHLTRGAGTWSPQAPEKPIAKSKRALDDDARDDAIAKNIQKVHKDIYGEQA
jgi:hypothetical protein